VVWLLQLEEIGNTLPRYGGVLIGSHDPDSIVGPAHRERVVQEMVVHAMQVLDVVAPLQCVTLVLRVPRKHVDSKPASGAFAESPPQGLIGGEPLTRPGCVLPGQLADAGVAEEARQFCGERSMVRVPKADDC
jgi:hypothetical protein